MSDPLRTGAIFKLDLSKVRSPPVVKFTVADVPKFESGQHTTSSVKKDPIKEAFNEIYRRTPVPAILLSSSKNRASGSLGSSEQRQWDRPDIPSSLARLMNSGDTLQDTDDESNPVDGGSMEETVKRTVMGSLHKRKSIEPIETTENAVYAGDSLKRSKADSSSKKPPTTISLQQNTDQSTNSRAGGSHSDRGSIERAAASPTLIPKQSTREFHQPISQSTVQLLARSVSAPSRGSSRTRGGGDSLLMLAAAPTVAAKPVTSESGVVISTGSALARQKGVSQQAASAQNANRNTTEEGRKLGSVLSSGTAIVPTKKAVATPANEHSKSIAGADGDASDDSDTEHVNHPAARRRGRPPGSQNRKPAAKSETKTSIAKASAGLKRPIHQKEVSNERPPSHSEVESSGPSSAEEASEEEHSGSERKRRVSKGNGRTSDAKGEQATDRAQDAAQVEKDATVTRSGRTSIPKKVIPTIGESDEPRTKGRSRGRPRLSGSPSKAAKPGMASGAPRQPAARKKAAPTQMSSSRGNTKGQGQGQRGQAEEPVPGSAWQPRETIALYSVQSRVDVTAPDFWDIVSDDLAEMDVFRTAEECQQRWFESVREAEERKRVNAERKRLKEAQTQSQSGGAAARTGGSQQAPQHSLIDASRSLLGSAEHAHAADRAAAEKGTQEMKSTEKGPHSEGSGAPSNSNSAEPVKNKRVSKAEMKKMAAASLKATRDDDIFESGEMQNYFNPVIPEQDALLDLLDSLDLPGDGELLPAFGESVPSSSSLTAGPGDRDEGGPMFASSHVHKLHYKPQFKVPRTGTNSAGNSQGGPSGPSHAVSGASKAVMGRMMKNGVVNAELVKKQARADLGVQDADSGSESEDSEEGEGSSDDGSQD